MWIFPRPIDQLTEADLTALITNQVRESVTLNYKRQTYSTSTSEINKMHRDVASLANAQGGEVEANRLVQSSNASIAERIPGAPQV